MNTEWKPMSNEEAAAMGQRVKSGEASPDECARYYMTNMVFIIEQWAKGAIRDENLPAYATVLVEYATGVRDLYARESS